MVILHPISLPPECVLRNKMELTKHGIIFVRIHKKSRGWGKEEALWKEALNTFCKHR